MNISPRLTKILKVVYSTTKNPIAYDILYKGTTEKGDYLDIKGDFLTYVPTSKMELAEEDGDFYRPKYRVRGKPARVLRKFVSVSFPDYQYEFIHNHIKASTFGPRNLSLERGEGIKDVYLKLYDDSVDCRMMQSCMVRDYESDDFNNARFELYVSNPSSVRLLTFWGDTPKGKRAQGRALLWKTSKGLYLDRIYGSDLAKSFMFEYATKKGWSTSNTPEGKGYVEVEKAYYPVMPYLDSYRNTVYNTRDGKHLLI